MLLLLLNSTPGIAQTIKDEERSKDDVLLDRGLQLLTQGKTDSAEAVFVRLTRQDVSENEPALYIRAQLNIGRIYGDKGDNVVALQHYHEALQKAESLNDKKLVAPILKNIGVLYISWKKFDKALEYYDKAENMAKEINNEELMADCQNNKGTVYEQREQYDQALKAYKNALDVYTRKNLKNKIAMALSNVAIVYKFQKNYQESLTYNFKAIALAEQAGDKWNLAATYNNIGNLYGEMNQYQNALLYCEKALALAQEIDAQEIIESIYDSMAEAAAKAGDFKKAFEYHKLFSEALSQFINAENTRQLSELNVKYETEKKLVLIQQQQFEINRKNYWLITVFIVFLLAGIATYFIWRNYRDNHNRKLKEEIFRQQKIEARALFDGEQTERIRIARDLHDGVGQMLSLVKMNLSTQDPGNTLVLKTMDLVDKTIVEVRNVSHNLIPEELNFGIIPALENLTEKVNGSGIQKMEIELGPGIKEKKFERRNEVTIFRIVQEVLNNMIKHADASLIRLSLKQISNSLIVSIKDNGRGVNADELSNSKGIGWKNINARVNMLGGVIKVQSEKLSGTHIEIILNIE